MYKKRGGDIPQTLLALTNILPLIESENVSIELVVEPPVHPEGIVHV